MSIDVDWAAFCNVRNSQSNLLQCQEKERINVQKEEILSQIVETLLTSLWALTTSILPIRSKPMSQIPPLLARSRFCILLFLSPNYSGRHPIAIQSLFSLKFGLLCSRSSTLDFREIISTFAIQRASILFNYVSRRRNPIECNGKTNSNAGLLMKPFLDMNIGWYFTWKLGQVQGKGDNRRFPNFAKCIKWFVTLAFHKIVARKSWVRSVCVSPAIAPSPMFIVPS